jgi:hypothetical protein
MNRATFLSLFCVIMTHVFGQSIRSVVAWTCLNNDVNNVENTYLINSKGEKKILNQMSPVEFDPFFNYGLKFMYDEKTKKMGCIDEHGKWAIEPIFDYNMNSSFSEGLACVSLNLKFGYIDIKGNWIIKPTFSNAFGFQNGLALVNKGSDNYNFEKDGYFINKNGDEVSKWSDYEFEFAYQGKMALATDKKGDKTKYGLYSFEKKKFITKVEYEVNNYLFGEIDQSIPMFPVSKNGKWGFIDDKGKIKIPMKYDNALPFSNGLAAVKLNEKWGFIDSKGKLIIPCKFNYILPFRHERAVGEFSFIDKKGNPLDIQLKEEYKLFFEEGMTKWDSEFIGLTNEQGSWDVLNWKGEVIWKGNCEGELTCFPKGSIVKLMNGSSKRIEEVKIGDELKSYDKGNLVSSKVIEIEIHENTKQALFEISFDNPNLIFADLSNSFSTQTNTLKITGNHPILTTNGIKKAQDILPTDVFFYFDPTTNEFSEVKIRSISKIPFTGKVYNLKTTLPNYIVENIVVMMK